MAMDRFLEGGKEEQGLLEILRNSHNTEEIKRVCLSLAHTGTIYSLPILAARMADTTKEMEQIFQTTINLIGAKHNVPNELWNSLSDPNQWKPQWNGPPESFLAFVEMFSMTTNEPDIAKATDRLGEVFMKVMEVDLSPYKNFREMRISATGNHLENFAERITDHLQSQVMVNDLLGDVSIDSARIEIHEELYGALQMDYFLTRMQQYLKFADE